jgi:hypothetical protein
VAILELTQGFRALIDDDDYAWLSQFKWHIARIGKANRPRRSDKLYLSRIILDAPKGMVVDHINGDTLDNRRVNLRICSVGNNRKNNRIYARNKTGFKGVTIHKKYGKYQAFIVNNKKSIWLGYYDSAENSGRAYDVAAKKYHGEFACLNFPDKEAA